MGFKVGSRYVSAAYIGSKTFTIGYVGSHPIAGLPSLPEGFAYSQFADGSYEVWPDGAYVVEYVG